MVMIPNPRDIKDVLDSIQKYRASVYPGVPTMYNAININPDVIVEKYDLSSIKALHIRISAVDVWKRSRDLKP